MKTEWTVQQRLWIWGRTFLKAMVPLALYILMPALCLSLGYVLFHSEMSAQDFFTYGGNFYSAVGMVLTVLVLFLEEQVQKSQFF